MAIIPELLDGDVTLEVECLDRLYLNGYIGKLTTGPGLVFFMREQLDKPIPSPVVLGQISEEFREAVKARHFPQWRAGARGILHIDFGNRDVIALVLPPSGRQHAAIRSQ